MNLFSLLHFIVTHPVNRNRPVAAVRDFLGWQLGTRLLGHPQVAYRWISDTRFLVRRGETGLTMNIYCGLQEISEMSYVLHALRSGELFADIGANVGSYTLLAGGVRRARVISFEPSPDTFARLVDNIRLNALEGRVTARNEAVGEKEATLRFSAEQDCTSHVLGSGEGGEGLGVPVTTLDRALAGDVPEMMKIDVEGFEMAVLRGGSRTLADPRLHSVLLETGSAARRYGFTEEEVLAAMRSHGFSPFKYDPFARNLRAMEGMEESDLNAIFIRDVERARQRVRESEPFRIKNVTL